MRQARGERASPGKFRTIQNWIGPSNSRIEHAIYVPPPPELLMECLTDWERFVNTRDLMPDLIQCAVMHEQFEAIHPFIDGNGRMGRLLITLFLMERARLSQPLLYLSAYIEARRLDYYDLLQQVRTDGDWTAWFHFFLAGVELTAREAARQTMQFIDLREEIQRRVRDKPKALALVDHLFFNPYITVRRAREILDVTAPTARSAIAALENAGMVTDITEGAWRRLYLCRPILDVLVAVDAVAAPQIRPSNSAANRR
jgi:Fic family protein